MKKDFIVRRSITMVEGKPHIETYSEQELIRCKDCKHATMTSDGKMCKYCEMDTDDFGYPRCVYHDADWFCADGVKRNG